MNRSLYPKHKASNTSQATGTLRLLATTDLHAHLLPYDYGKDKPAPGTGLAGLGTLINQAREEAASQGAGCILVDNGDNFQGTPLAEHLAARPVTADHAIAASLAAMRYDAVGIGNHDFDYGLPYLRSVAEHIGAPVVCSNLHGVTIDPIRSYALVPCKMPDSNGTGMHELKIGILSILPALTSIWNRHTLGAQAEVEPPASCVARQVAHLRQVGAELIVVLAHMGMGEHSDIDTAHAGALALRDVPGVDVLVTGHTHRRLPGSDYADREGIDATGGRVGKIPAVMAGHAGSDLGVLDLTLERGEEGSWTVASHAGRLLPNTAKTPEHPAIRRCAKAADTATRAHMSEKVATTETTLHSYFALVTAAPTTRLVAEAKAGCIRDAISETAHAGLPLLATSAAHSSGGRAGPDHYLYIPKGDILRRHIAGLSPYANNIVAMLISGRELRDRLEFSARIFSQLAPDRPDQPLINSGVPSFHFDSVFGVTYQIDAASPVGSRIHDLCYEGVPVRPDQRFVLATNQFRAAGGGGYAPCAPDQIIAQCPQPFHDTLIAHLQKPKGCAWQKASPWRFAPLCGVETTFNTSVDAAAHLDDISYLSPRACGHTDDGFLRVRITL